MNRNRTSTIDYFSIIFLYIFNIFKFFSRFCFQHFFFFSVSPQHRMNRNRTEDRIIAQNIRDIREETSRVNSRPTSHIRPLMPEQQMHTVSFDWFLSSLEWILFTKTFAILPEIIMEYYTDIGSTLHHFEFLSLYIFTYNLLTSQFF